MRGHHRRLAAALGALLFWGATETAEANALQPHFDDSFPDARSLTLPAPDLAPPPEPPIEFAAGASADAQGLFRLPDAPAPQIEGPFAHFERRSERASFLPWDLLEDEESGFAAEPLLPLLGATALLLWLVVTGSASEAGRPRRRRRRRRRSAGSPA